ADNYNIYADKDLVMGVSFNFNRKESDLTCYNSDQLKEQLKSSGLININVLEVNSKSLTSSLSEAEQGKKLWKLCLLLTLVFLAFEVLLLRFMKG
ncbi:MAG: hypothetical protein ACXVDW_05375, partial [Bacteroidia bacterium]